jgi:hypothetical protein
MKRNEKEEVEPNTKLTKQSLKFPAATGSIEMIENIDGTLDLDWIGVDWIRLDWTLASFNLISFCFEEIFLLIKMKSLMRVRLSKVIISNNHNKY